MDEPDTFTQIVTANRVIMEWVWVGLVVAGVLLVVLGCMIEK